MNYLYLTRAINKSSWLGNRVWTSELVGWSSSSWRKLASARRDSAVCKQAWFKWRVDSGDRGDKREGAWKLAKRPICVFM